MTNAMYVEKFSSKKKDFEYEDERRKSKKDDKRFRDMRKQKRNHKRSDSED